MALRQTKEIGEKDQRSVQHWLARNSLAAGNMLRIAGIHQHHGRAELLKDLEDGNPVNAGGFHGDCADSALLEPVGKAVQVPREGAEAADRFRIAVRSNSCYVYGGSDVDRGRVGGGFDRLIEARGARHLHPVAQPPRRVRVQPQLKRTRDRNLSMLQSRDWPKSQLGGRPCVYFPFGIFALISLTPPYAPPNSAPEASHDRGSKEAS